MQPNAPVPTGYEFLNNSPQRKKSLLPGGDSKKSRLIVVGVGVVILLIVGMVIASLLGNAGKAAQQDLLTAAQQQQELIRISGIGAEKARDTTTRNRAITTKLTMESDQRQLLALAKKQGRVIQPKELALGKNSKTDAALAAADQANRFDEAFNEELVKELTAYQQTIKRLYDNADSKALKDGLTVLFNNIAPLAPPAKQ